MIFIDLENKKPTDTDIPGWTPWTQAQWDAWLLKSQQLVEQMAALDAAGQRDARNAIIDENSRHWGKLKSWLLALSGGKCWFAEVRELYSHYDVEHFRPKKQAKELNGKDRDGYWWLAFDYMNFRVCANVGNRKKGCWFPLQDGSLCSTYSNPCEESESRYLLDPIDPTDVMLLAFDEEGKTIAAPGTSEWEQQRVEETVKRLKLNDHVKLAEERRKVWQKINRLVDIYESTRARCASGNNPAVREKLKAICTQIREMTTTEAELSSVARWCLLLRNDPHLARMVA